MSLSGLPLTWLYTVICSAFVVIRTVDITVLISNFGITGGLSSVPGKKNFSNAVVVLIYTYTTEILLIIYKSRENFLVLKGSEADGRVGS